MATSSRRSYNGPVLRSISPTRRFSSSTQSSSVRFSLERTTSSPNRSIAHSPGRSQVMTKKPGGPARLSSCMCSPTTHPGSFRCRLHKNDNRSGDNAKTTTSYCSNKLRRSAMANSLVRIGAVEGVDMVKRSLAALIRPSSYQLRRREDFERRPSRLSSMSKI